MSFTHGACVNFESNVALGQSLSCRHRAVFIESVQHLLASIVHDLLEAVAIEPKHHDVRVFIEASNLELTVIVIEERFDAGCLLDEVALDALVDHGVHRRDLHH